MRRRSTTLLAAIALTLTVAGPVLAGPFDRSARQYDALVNHILQHIGSDVRLQLEGCYTSHRVLCRFSSLRVAVRVQGRENPPRIEKIAISADLLGEEDAADALAAVTDVVLVYGATMVIFDPDLRRDRRVQLLSDTIEKALTTGPSEEDGLEAHYTTMFDEAADGQLVVVIIPRE